MRQESKSNPSWRMRKSSNRQSPTSASAPIKSEAATQDAPPRMKTP
jgi:hypothetical protein